MHGRLGRDMESGGGGRSNLMFWWVRFYSEVGNFDTYAKHGVGGKNISCVLFGLSW